MSKNLRELIKSQRIYLDGGTGTVLQSMGLPAGTPPEMWNVQNPSAVTSLHRSYFESGSNIVNANTFGINCEKYENYKELIKCAFDCAKAAREEFDGDRFIALDIGPTGCLL